MNVPKLGRFIDKYKSFHLFLVITWRQTSGIAGAHASHRTCVPDDLIVIRHRIFLHRNIRFRFFVTLDKSWSGFQLLDQLLELVVGRSNQLPRLLVRVILVHPKVGEFVALVPEKSKILCKLNNTRDCDEDLLGQVSKCTGRY